MVWQFTGSVLVGVAAGYGVDRWRGVGPWGLIIGGGVGTVTGLYAFITNSTRLLDAQARRRAQESKGKGDEAKP